jgi:hypothetical protein
MKNKNKRTNVIVAATAYVNRQLEIMRAYGSAPKLTAKERRDLIQRVAQVSQ